MKALKIILAVVLLVVVLIVISLFWVGNNINSLVKTAVEEAGSNALKTSVLLESADVDLMAGRVQLSGLTVANPSGFNESQAFSMKDIVVDVELESLRDGVIEVKEVSTEGIRVVAEQKGTTTNLQTLLDNIDTGSDSSSSQPSEGQSTESPDVLIKVSLMSFTDGSIYLVSDRWGDNDLALPGIKLTNIGGDKGVPPDQLAELIVEPLLAQLTDAVEDGLEDIVKDAAKEKLSEKEDELKQKLDEKLGDKLGTDREALKSLFGR